VTKLTVTQLAIYPVKSLAGISLQAMTLGARGPEFDRHWLVADPDGQFITQRQQPRMCLVRTELQTDALLLTAPGVETLRLPLLAPDSAARSIVTVWRDTVAACDAGSAAAQWLSDFLKTPCRLHYLPDDTVRPVDPAYARSEDEVGFADGFPFLLITEASLQAFNAELPTPIGSERFRPNIVLSGTAPYAEDAWCRLRIGDIEFDVAKPCARCVIPSLDPATGERQPVVSKALARTRRRDNAVYFGQNLIHRGLGTIRVGDEAVVLE
jgi:uncharacterized protein YcbX